MYVSCFWKYWELDLGFLLTCIKICNLIYNLKVNFAEYSGNFKFDLAKFLYDHACLVIFVVLVNLKIKTKDNKIILIM